MKKSEIFFGLIRIPLDFGLALAALFSANYLRTQEFFLSILKKPDLGIFPSQADFLKLSIIAAFLLVAVLSFFQMYALKITTGFGREIRKIVAGASIWLMAVISYYFLIREFPFSRLVLFYGYFFLTVYLVLGHGIIRMTQKALLKRGIGRRQVVLLGDSHMAEILKKNIASQNLYEIVSVTDNFEGLQKAVSYYSIDEVIQTKRLHDGTVESVLEFCREHHLVYHFVPDILEVSRTNVEVKIIGDIPVISLKPTPLDGWGKVSKRTFDIVCSFFGLLFLSPVFLVIALFIKFDSAGTVFFRFLDDGKTMAKRVGQFGKLFHCLKFRTMKSGTHNLRYSAQFSGKNLRHDSPLVKIENDPRITRVGKFLRKYSLDELPQLWNVLKGEMSLAGPRPHLPEEVEKYEGYHKFVHTIKPGITGLAQVSGRSDLPFEEEVRLDTYYIENWTIWMDIKILLKTFAVVFRGYRE